MAEPNFDIVSANLKNLQDQIDIKIKNLRTEIEKLTKICFTYSEEVYNFIGNFRKDNLDPKQIQALDILKSVVDDCLANEAYKNYLEGVYIRKDYYKSINDNELLAQIKDIKDKYYTDLYCDGDFIDD